MFYKIIAYAFLFVVLNGNGVVLGMELAERIDPTKTRLSITAAQDKVGRSLSFIIQCDISGITFQQACAKEISLKKFNENDNFHNLTIGTKIIAQVETSILNMFVRKIGGYANEYTLKFEILDKNCHLCLAQCRGLTGFLDDYVEISFESQFSDSSNFLIEESTEEDQKMLLEKNYNFLMLRSQEQEKRAENKDRLFKTSLYCGICLAMVLVGCWLRHIYTS